MKKAQKQYKFISFRDLFKDFIVQDRLVSLNSIELLALLRRLGWRLILASFTRGVSLPRRIRQLLGFGRYLLRMKKHHGDVYVVKYLKASQLCLQKRIAEDRISSLRDLEPDLPLPRIPQEDRRAICQGSPSVIRWWLTVFSLYRVLNIPGKLKLSTITDPFSGNWERLAVIQDEIKVLTPTYFGEFTKSLSLPELDLQWLSKSSSTHKVS